MQPIVEKARPLPNAGGSAPLLRVAADALPPERTINPRSIVGIICDFKVDYIYPPTGEIVASEVRPARGSGVIFDRRGYVLTNRHVVAETEEPATATVGGKTIELVARSTRGACFLGNIPEGFSLPSADEIQTFNPTIRIPVAGYSADVLYIPEGDRYSPAEKDLIDFAILKISGVSPEGPTFGVDTLPAEFPFAEMLESKPYALAGERVFTYGSPADAVTVGRDDFKTLNVVGGVGTVTRVEFGEKFFADFPLSIWTKLEARPGRSGSPLFWRGYVIGLLTASSISDRTESRSVSVDAIKKDLKAASFGF